MSTADAGHCKVIVPRAESEKLKRWGEWAARAGVSDDFVAAPKTLNYRLTVEPAEWGEPRYTLRHLELEVRVGMFSMLNVWYGVHRRERRVFVKVFQLRPDYLPGNRPDEGGPA